MPSEPAHIVETVRVAYAARDDLWARALVEDLEARHAGLGLHVATGALLDLIRDVPIDVEPIYLAWLSDAHDGRPSREEAIRRARHLWYERGRNGGKLPVHYAVSHLLGHVGGEGARHFAWGLAFTCSAIVGEWPVGFAWDGEGRVFLEGLLRRYVEAAGERT